MIATATKTQLDRIFQSTHSDYKAVSNCGTRMILVCRGATTLVALEDLTADEVAQRLRKPKK